MFTANVFLLTGSKLFICFSLHSEFTGRIIIKHQRIAVVNLSYEKGTYLQKCPWILHYLNYPHLTLNQRVWGSSPQGITIEYNKCEMNCYPKSRQVLKKYQSTFLIQ